MKSLSKIYLEIYYDILRIRLIELEISKSYSDQKMRCPVHLSIGQEDIATIICKNLKITDIIMSTHRSHAHYLAKGGSLNKMIAELHGKSSGCISGRGGSMHIMDIDKGVYPCIPIVGSAIGISTGIAQGLKHQNKNSIIVCFFGDAAVEEGIFYESINYAIIHNLPIIYVCENNLFSVYTSLKERQPYNRKISKMVEGFGIKSFKINGEVLDKYKRFKEIKEYTSSHNRPVFVEFDTFRQYEHCGPHKDDNLNYREKKYVLKGIKSDPLLKLEKILFKNNILNNQTKNKYIKKIDHEIKNAFSASQRSLFPKSSFQTKDIYAE